MFTKSDDPFASEPTPPGQIPQDGRGAFDASVGLVLIVLGAIFLAQRLLGFNLWRWSWPFLIIAPGALFLVASVAFGRRASGLAIPGCIITTLGLILLLQNTLNAWQTWAYVWTLLVPTSIGVGIWLHGTLSGQMRAQRTGRAMATVGLGLFVGFAVLFEGIFNISRGHGGGFAGLGIAVVLILAGLYLIIQKNDRSAFV